MTNKRCKKCLNDLTEHDFRAQPSVYIAKDGTHRHYTKMSNVCYSCENKQARIRRLQYPDKYYYLKDIYYGY